jgi:RNA polymerase sigma factor (sigma-70 family)
VTAEDARRAIEAVYRIESPRLIAGLTRVVRDLDTAEDLAHDALAAALQQWPESGVPRNPGAWLMATAKNRGLDLLRRRKVAERKHAEIGRERQEQEAAMPDLPGALDDDIEDDLLRLVFTACHPVLSTEARVALTLRLLGGLSTEEIARAFLVSEPTCWRSSTSSSMRATPRPRGRTGCGRRCARRRCAWGVSWPSWRPGSRRCTAWSA